MNYCRRILFREADAAMPFWQRKEPGFGGEAVFPLDSTKKQLVFYLRRQIRGEKNRVLAAKPFFPLIPPKNGSFSIFAAKFEARSFFSGKTAEALI
ncbi:MAG: hypothetical protein K5774_08540 [Clostridia bacterium]|nr:hypothetical protein [Clostridia bacterium]